VIIGEDGYVLTAAHVAGEPGRRATVILADGRQLKGKTLGVFRTLDAGLVKITSEGSWPHSELSPDPEVKRGQWVIATGHPGGVQAGRRPALRVGRILLVDGFAITTDCTLIGGDSGGPLFDMQGRVIGVNSRIGRSLDANLHVPVAAYQNHWDRLARGDSWGHFPGTGPYLGVEGTGDPNVAKIAAVRAGTPAAAAGIKVGDVILEFDGKPITDFPSLQEKVLDADPGDRVQVRIRRGDVERELELTLGRRRP
jgi:serine protease Do